jgi:hypothetical protein
MAKFLFSQRLASLRVRVPGDMQPRRPSAKVAINLRTPSVPGLASDSDTPLPFITDLIQDFYLKELRTYKAPPVVSHTIRVSGLPRLRRLRRKYRPRMPMLVS